MGSISLVPSQRESIQNDSNPKLKLSKLSLPEFFGNYADYLTFIDSFDKIIHENENLTNVDKFH